MREETEELLQGKFKILRELYKNGQSVGGYSAAILQCRSEQTVQTVHFSYF